MPNIGYGSNRKTRHMISNGLRKFVVSNVKVSLVMRWGLFVMCSRIINLVLVQGGATPIGTLL